MSSPMNNQLFMKAFSQILEEKGYSEAQKCGGQTANRYQIADGNAVGGQGVDRELTLPASDAQRLLQEGNLICQDD